MARKSDCRAGIVLGEDASGIVQRIQDLGQRCETLESSNKFLAAQLAEVNRAWRDAMAAFASANPDKVVSNAVRELAEQSSGLRRRIFSEMADILEQALERG